MVVRLDGRELRLFSTITTFGTPMDVTVDELAIESSYPADPASAAYFARAPVSPPTTGMRDMSRKLKPAEGQLTNEEK